MSLTIPNRKYDRNIIVDECIKYITLDVADGIIQEKNLNLPFVPDELTVLNFGVINNQYYFQRLLPALTCDFIERNQILAVYNNRFPNNAIGQSNRHRYIVSFQKDNRGRKAEFRLNLLNPDGTLLDTTLQNSIYTIQLYFVKYKRFKLK